jgi:carbon monoxide dehydrogenase subunit G
VRLDHEFTVPAPIEEVWKAVVDPERVAPCMPGATVTGVDGDTFKGTVKVKLGPISLLYKGSGEFVEKDADARRLVIKASGKDARGAGTASATVTLTLIEKDAVTFGAVATELAVTGRPAQFGRGMIAEVGGKILDSFAECLSGKLAPAQDPSPSERPAEHRPALKAVEPVPEAEAIDLVDYAGESVMKRLAPVLAIAAVVLAVVAIVRALRH